MNYDAPPTQDEIDTAFRLKEEYEKATPSTPDEATVVAQRIYGDWQTARAEGRSTTKDILEFIAEIGAKHEVTSPDRGSVRAFWAYESQPEGAHEPIQHRFLARAMGASRGLQVLQETEGGRRMDSYRLEGELVPNALEREYGVDGKRLKTVVDDAWVNLSERYAREATGPVVALVGDIAERTVLGKDELPILLAHEKVGKEGVKFPVPLPENEHLPRGIHSFIAHPELRSQMRMEDYAKDKSPKEFAAKLAGLDVPENEREAHEAALWRLSTANTYDELNTRAAQNVPAQQQHSAFTPGLTTKPATRPAAPRGPTGHGVYNPTAIAPPAPEPTGAAL
ncbi:hypothetical protein ACFUJR_12615 [Streptomyces sp. NPDC057271]|uniref:hypothetical protein n=1 Tax=unclassified Streptomyces TaxID=2593676 RepID=UPI003629546D